MIVELAHRDRIVDRIRTDHDPGYTLGDIIQTAAKTYIVIQRWWDLRTPERRLIIKLRERYNDPGHLDFCTTCAADAIPLEQEGSNDPTTAGPADDTPTRV